MLACLLAMLPSPFLWQGKMPVHLRGAFLGIVLLCFEFFTFLAIEPKYSMYQILPLEMFSLCLCVSTLFLRERIVFFAVLAQICSLWVIFFGMFSSSYHGKEYMDYLPMGMLLLGIILSPLLALRKQNSRFFMAAYWAAVWVFAFTPV
jgi:hypothetical protein